MNVSVLDLYRIGPGPSSSHTVGPMVAARTFAAELAETGAAESVRRVQVDLLGSLGATGRGHATDSAVLAGLAGVQPRHSDAAATRRLVEEIERTGTLRLLGAHPVALDPADDVRMLGREVHPGHPNAMRLRALGPAGDVVLTRTFLSVGGGFVVDADAPAESDAGRPTAPAPFRTADELLAHCAVAGTPISDVMLRNETAWHELQAVTTHLDEVWSVMQACVDAGARADGMLPGPLGVRRRAARLAEQLTAAGDDDPLRALDWVSVWAMAVNEQNACGELVVTAPTNGAAGVLPAVLHYLVRYHPEQADVRRFLLTAAAIAVIVKSTASISGAEVGCQGEVGTASAMAAAGLADALGGSPAQVEQAAEIALEHHLGLTCDPVAGLVQIPCIERNAVGAAKAIQAARLALAGDGSHRVSFDTAVETMRRTGADMHSNYKETARGGLALTVVC